ncbi:hypothetical protein EUGRSUZ_F03031 [Eucalyptus grandis]|uniref:protein disulfide-isomerase n=2 Tax=Eucalyptus grandis TaxID=71139 RepID=A0A059BTL5_EUCGR|nr:hypothetical protein EUGRSUZ_F03031 [Eucalyptus grandis]
MILGKPIWRFALLALTILLLLSLAISEPTEKEIFDDEDSEGIEELLAVDDEAEQEQETHGKFSDAEVLTKAQRIVLELNSDSAKRVIEQNEYVLVLGYAPWCARSAELMPQFAEAANTLKALGSSVVLAKLDAERYPKAASGLEIKGFPTLLLFVNGTSQAYTGGYSAEEIVIWARKKTGVPVIRGPVYEEFVKTATADNEVQFVEVSNIEAARVLYPDIESSGFFLGIVKSEPERYAGYEGAFEMEKLLQFLDHNKFPLVTKLTELNSVRVYSSPIKLQLFVFAKAEDFKDLHEPLQDVARKFKSKIMFIYIDIADENLAKPFLTLYGLEDSEDTVVAAFDNQISSKYLLQTDATPANIEDFSSKFLQGSLSPYFKSQPVPDNKEASIQVVVGKTFDDIVLNSPKNVFLEVHTPWCINCETISKQVEKLANHFKDLNNLVFARIDASANEHPKLQVVDYPTLLFYPASDKANPIKVSAKSSLKNMAKVISKHVRSSDDAPKDEL